MSIRHPNHIIELARSLYAQRPSATLYHYTSVGSVQNIIAGRSLWATDIHYFNDAEELAHALGVIDRATTETAARLLNGERPQLASALIDMLGEFHTWLKQRLTSGHGLFVVSFTTNGNLLSQWRGYCPANKGISLGFHHDRLAQAASEQAFMIGRCIYDRDRHHHIASKILEGIIDLVRQRGGDPSAPPGEMYRAVFEEVEGDILRIAALLKNGAFREEDEWRVVSTPIADYMNTSIDYREGRTMLVPFVHFRLPGGPDRPVDLEHVFLGPTEHVNSSMSSLSNFFSRAKVSPSDGVGYCQIPYRQP